MSSPGQLPGANDWGDPSVALFYRKPAGAGAACLPVQSAAEARAQGRAPLRPPLRSRQRAGLPWPAEQALSHPRLGSHVMRQQ